MHARTHARTHAHTHTHTHERAYYTKFILYTKRATNMKTAVASKWTASYRLQQSTWKHKLYGSPLQTWSTTYSSLLFFNVALRPQRPPGPAGTTSTSSFTQLLSSDPVLCFPVADMQALLSLVKNDQSNDANCSLRQIRFLHGLFLRWPCAVDVMLKDPRPNSVHVDHSASPILYRLNCHRQRFGKIRSMWLILSSLCDRTTALISHWD